MQLLGVLSDSNLNWKPHITELSKKLARTVGVPLTLFGLGGGGGNGPLRLFAKYLKNSLTNLHETL